MKMNKIWLNRRRCQLGTHACAELDRSICVPYKWGGTAGTPRMTMYGEPGLPSTSFFFLTFRQKDVYMQSMRSYKPYVEFRLTESSIRLETPKGENRTIEISAGSSFGAEHPTTRLCIMGLEEIFKKRTVKRVLDFGCGSGVLGICAASLGADSVLAVDIDPMAVKEAQVNFEKNKLNSIGYVKHGSTEDVSGTFELIIANIVTDDLLTLVDWFKSMLKEDGILLVSGIYEMKKEALVADYTKAGFCVNSEYCESGWMAIWFESQ